MSRRAVAAVLPMLCAVALAPRPASGDPASDEQAADDAIGPVIRLEAVEVLGTVTTDPELVVRALPFRPGDALRAGDRRLRDARYKLLALGMFRDVALALRKGGERGLVILTVTVVERGTTELNRLWFGTSVASPWWVGADLGDRNLLGSGLAVDAGLVRAAAGDHVGARAQWAAELRLAAAALRGSPLGLRGALTWVHGSEPYRTSGATGDDDASRFAAFSFRRAAARGGVAWDASPFTQLWGELRVEAVAATLPAAPTRELPDGQQVAVPLYLDDGDSRIVALSLGFDRDTRSDPVLPRTGSRLTATAELGSSAVGGGYDFATLAVGAERWWPAGAAGAVGVRLAAGAVLGDAPRFDRLHVGDVDRLTTPRALGLVVSTEAPPLRLGAEAGVDGYGELGGGAMVEYGRRLFRRGGRIYGGDVFVGAGLWALASRDPLARRDAGWRDALPGGAVLDAGVRIDTEVGVFEFTLANALGRVPW